MSIPTNAFRGHGLSRLRRLHHALFPQESPSPFPSAVLKRKKIQKNRPFL